MPVGPCQEDGKPGYRWGGHGKCYTYTPGDDSSKTAAHAKATAQGQAAHAHGYKGGKDDDWEAFDYLDEISNSLDNLTIALDQLKKNLLPR